MDKIEGFKISHKYLSNMHLFQYPIKIKDIYYASSENYYQAMKTKNIPLRTMLGIVNPYEAKKASRGIILRDDWEDIKLKVMLKINRIKFRHFEHLGMMLLDTGDAYIEETNTWGDTFWGVCRGVGENHLGKILMQVREELREDTR